MKYTWEVLLRGGDVYGKPRVICMYMVLEAVPCYLLVVFEMTGLVDFGRENIVIIDQNF